MSISADELVFYGSANMPEQDGVTVGGAINTSVKVIFTSATLANSPNGAVRVNSAASGDTTQRVTITGRDSTGVTITETLNLNGTNVVSGSKQFERILKVVVNAAHSGTITVMNSAYTTIGTLESGILTLRRPFYNVSADVIGGSARTYYEKVFLKNTNSTLALLNAQITETSDPAELLTFALANTINDTESAANRQTAPTAVGVFSGLPKTVPGTDLAPGAAIGIWLMLILNAGATAQKTTYTLTVSGNSI